MNKIKSTFDKQFEHWGIELPEQDIREKKRGTIRSSGWFIRYRFDMEDGVDFVEYFAAHRMTSSSLDRIYADGRIENVDEEHEAFDQDDPNGLNNMFAHNERFNAMVRARGLALDSEE